jgi:shikimate 5-dehydrogenase
MFVAVGMLLLPAATLSAQAGTVPCKDGTRANGGHFSCWGHGGIGTAVVKSAPKSGAKSVAAAEKKTDSAKPAARKHASAKAAKAHQTKAAKKKAARKAHAKKGSKHDGK